MSNEDWKKAEQALSLPFGSVKMKIDGYNVTFSCIPEKPLKYVIAVYIDGTFKMKWATEDCEIRRRFCFKSKTSLLTAKQKKALKREKKAIREEVEKQMTFYTYLPYFNSFRSLKSQLIHNNESIELVEEI